MIRKFNSSLATILLIASHIVITGCGQGRESTVTRKPEKVIEPTQGQTPTPAPVVSGPIKIITTKSGLQIKLASHRSEIINPKLVYAFQGKGTALTWDIGGARAAYERIPLLRGETNAQAQSNGDVVLTGNSSGSVLAAWFTCRGFSAGSIRDAQNIMGQFPPSLVKESTSQKIMEIISAIREGREFGAPINAMLPMMDAITGKGSCVPQLPTVITTSNQDINDRRGWLASPIAQTRQFDMGDFSYRETMNPANGRSVKIGKICTYFADPVMFKYLTENISQEERLCDVRLMENADDVKLAVLASIAEPTYFLPIAETTDAKLVRYSNAAAQKKARVYNGGFSMPGVMQDVKRLFPQSRALSSGRWDYGTTESTVMKTWYDVEINDLQEISRWWSDLEMLPTESEKNSLLDRPDDMTGNTLAQRYGYEINLGYQRALKCLRKGAPCLPPRKSIIRGVDMYRPVFTHAAGQSSGTPIKTRQGLDTLIE